MTERGELISLLESLSEEKFRVFNEKIVPVSYTHLTLPTTSRV